MSVSICFLVALQGVLLPVKAHLPLCSSELVVSWLGGARFVWVCDQQRECLSNVLSLCYLLVSLLCSC